MRFSIRQATRKDAALILELIKDLAEYERAPDQVACSVEDIRRDGFGDQPAFSCFIAHQGDEPAGFALFFFKWSTWNGRKVLHLEDLFVKPAFRGQGLGLLLLKRLAKFAVDQGCLRFEWEVLDWNSSARDFYHRIGAGYKTEWLGYRLDGDALRRFAEEDL